MWAVIDRCLLHVAQYIVNATGVNGVDLGRMLSAAITVIVTAAAVAIAYIATSKLMAFGFVFTLGMYVRILWKMRRFTRSYATHRTLRGRIVLVMIVMVFFPSFTEEAALYGTSLNLVLMGILFNSLLANCQPPPPPKPKGSALPNPT